MTVPVVDAHCHLWIEPPRSVTGPRLADERLAAAELRAFRAAGGTAVLDCQPGGCGRDGRVLARLAEATGIDVAAATGFHLERYYGEDSPYGRDPDALAEEWRRELGEGLAEEPRVRARLVKSAWTGAGGGRERAMLAAAAEAAASACAPLVVHTERGAAAEALAELLSSTGLPPARAQLSHVDKRPDIALHRELAATGFTLGYDAFLRPRYRPEETTWLLLDELVSAGLWDRVTIGLDLADASAWSVSGGSGLPALGDEILPRLRDRFGQHAARGLIGGNALRLLLGTAAEVAR